MDHDAAAAIVTVAEIMTTEVVTTRPDCAGLDAPPGRTRALGGVVAFNLIIQVWFNVEEGFYVEPDARSRRNIRRLTSESQVLNHF